MVKMDSELFHAACDIMRTRDAQLAALGDDELMHYGRKGMKWNENLFTQVEEVKNKVNSRPPIPAARPAAANYGSGMQRPRTGNISNDLKAEQMRRKYGGTEQHYDTGRGAQVRENQRNIREAQAKYGGGSYYDIQKAESEKKRKAQNLIDMAKLREIRPGYAQTADSMRNQAAIKDARMHDREVLVTDNMVESHDDPNSYTHTTGTLRPGDRSDRTMLNYHSQDYKLKDHGGYDMEDRRALLDPNQRSKNDAMKKYGEFGLDDDMYEAYKDILDNPNISEDYKKTLVYNSQSNNYPKSKK